MTYSSFRHSPSFQERGIQTTTTPVTAVSLPNVNEPRHSEAKICKRTKILKNYNNYKDILFILSNTTFFLYKKDDVLMPIAMSVIDTPMSPVKRDMVFSLLVDATAYDDAQ